MTRRFDVVSTYEKRDFAEIYNAMTYQIWAAKKWSLFLCKFKLPIALVFAGMGVFRIVYAATHGFDGFNLFFAVTSFAMAWLIVKRPTENTKTVKWLWNTYDRKGAEMVFSFDEEEMTFSSGGEEQRHQYESVLSILENKEYFFLVMGKNQISCALHKNNFKVGSPDTFREFIEEKTGISVETFK